MACPTLRRLYTLLSNKQANTKIHHQIPHQPWNPVMHGGICKIEWSDHTQLFEVCAPHI